MDSPYTPATHPNDGFFKAVFSQPEHATAFFKSHLPSAIAERIDWTSLTVLPGSFVKTSLQQVHSDLLFSVRIGGRATLLYLLFEHQSTPDPAMPLRLLGYMMEIFARHHKEQGLPLPPVLPFVFHQGPEAWNVTTAFEDLFALPDELASELLPYLPKFH
ncbi:Rpn family recombination-promoting nuclease/putative transposase, partial [bacterium]|nr:Rpn family recombination-promoting nuclease/putative transposase [bacterium]